MVERELERLYAAAEACNVARRGASCSRKDEEATTSTDPSPTEDDTQQRFSQLSGAKAAVGPHEGLLTTASTSRFSEATLEHFNLGDQAKLHRLEAGVLVEAPCCRILGPHAAGH
jgi:hypothetical protein